MNTRLDATLNENPKLSRIRSIILKRVERALDRGEWLKAEMELRKLDLAREIHS